MFTKNLREFDLVGRYGGEEFVVIIPEADHKSVIEIAERIRIAVQTMTVKTQEGETNVTVSIGVCIKSAAEQDLEKLIEMAGESVHNAKLNGRNCVVINMLV